MTEQAIGCRSVDGVREEGEKDSKGRSTPNIRGDYRFIILIMHSSFVAVYVCQNSSNCTFQICAVYYIWILPEWGCKNCARSKTKDMFIAVLFVIDKNWKQSSSSAGEWISKVCCVPTTEYYVAVRKNEALIHAIETCYDMGKSQKLYAKWKKPETKDCILYDTIFVRILGKAKL